tara:strand:+ start:2843 stop:3052 length:210 start_codon:yes stop_codon:yes gene_type:complete
LGLAPFPGGLRRERSVAAKSTGWWAEGSVEDPADINGGLLRAIEPVKAGKPALIDTTRNTAEIYEWLNY